MFNGFITSINYKELIKRQANQESYRISKKEIKGQYKNPIVASQKKRVIKIGKRK